MNMIDHVIVIQKFKRNASYAVLDILGSFCMCDPIKSYEFWFSFDHCANNLQATPFIPPPSPS